MSVAMDSRRRYKEFPASSRMRKTILSIAHNRLALPNKETSNFTQTLK